MQNIKNLFEELDTKDPKITISHDTVSLSPYYWNYYFVSTLIPIAGAIYILIRQNDEKINFFCMLILIASLIILMIHLKYCNTVVVNNANKSIVVDPNLIMKFFVKKNIISFNDVRKFQVVTNSNTGGWRSTYRRYIIAIVLKNSEKIELISTDNFSIAKQIEKGFTLLPGLNKPVNN